MKHNKILIILIIVIAVLVLAAGGFVLAYMTTDILKTDEQLFYKYISEVGKDITAFNSQELADYEKKVQTTPYESNGSLTVNVTAPDDISEQMNLDIVNNMEIAFTGKTDKLNNLSEQNINLNYSDEVSFPILYRHTGNMYGITSDIIVNGIITVRDENLPELFEKLGIEAEIPNSIETAIPSITEEQLANELPKLRQIIIDNLTTENFSKVDENDFVLTLTQRQFMTIVLQMVEEIKSSGILSANIIETINEAEKNVQNEQLSDEEFVKIVVSKDKKVIVSVNEEIIATLTSTNGVITIQVTDEEDAPVIVLQKIKNENDLSYQMSYSQEGMEVSFVENYTGLQTQTVNEDYLLTLSMIDSNDEETSNTQNQKIEYQYNLNTLKTFVDSVDIEELNSNTAYILNDQSAETLQVLLQALGNSIVSVNEEQMQQLGVTVNPLVNATPIGLLSLTFNPIGNDSNTSMEMQQVQMFNSTFVSYEGLQNGTTTKTLISTVISNNQTNPDHIVSVNGYTDAASLETLFNQLNVSSNYNITLTTDSEGYIYLINIATV